MRIDAFGLLCPKPLMLAKKAIDEGNTAFAIAVDNEASVKNLTHLGETADFHTEVNEIEGGFLVSFEASNPDDRSLNGSAAQTSPAIANKEATGGTNVSTATADATMMPYAVFCGKERIGEGDPILGDNLMKMALFTLSESSTPPTCLIFMNSGVKLVAGDNDNTIESVGKLVEKGTEVLVCGTCLDFYGLNGDLKVGHVSNMYDILEGMTASSKVISF